MRTEGVRKLWNRYKFVGLLVLLGAGLLLWPDTGAQTALPPEQAVLQRDLEKDMEEILSAMSGVGQTKVLLTLDSDGERQFAQDTQLAYSGQTAAPEDYSRRSETVLADGGAGNEAVVVQRMYPTYRGALVVCQGGGSAEVRLAVTEAVAALTGLSADRITVAKWQ